MPAWRWCSRGCATSGTDPLIRIKLRNPAEPGPLRARGQEFRYICPGDVSSADDLAAGEGAAIREGLSKVATYKAEDGTIVTRSAACTHLGCQVLSDPAVKPLSAVDS